MFMNNKKTLQNVFMPEFANDMIPTKIMSIKLSRLQALIWNKVTGKLTSVPIKGTPHYKFIKQYQENANFNYHMTDYYEYAQRYLNGENSVKKFIELYHEMTNKGYRFGEYRNHFCLVYRRVPIGRYKVYDGLHRLAIIEAIDIRQIEVALLKSKTNWLLRLLRRLNRWFK